MSSRGPSGRILSQVLRTKTLDADLHAQGCRSQHALATARLAQSAERKALNLVVVGSSPTVGVLPTLLVASKEPPMGIEPMTIRLRSACVTYRATGASLCRRVLAHCLSVLCPCGSFVGVAKAEGGRTGD